MKDDDDDDHHHHDDDWWWWVRRTTQELDVQAFFENNHSICSLVLTWPAVERIINAEEEEWTSQGENIKQLIKGSQLGNNNFSNAAVMLQAKQINKAKQDVLKAMPHQIDKAKLQ